MMSIKTTQPITSFFITAPPWRVLVECRIAPSIADRTSDTSESHPLIVPLDYTAIEAIDLDHILTILGRILTMPVRIGPAVGKCSRYGSRFPPYGEARFQEARTAQSEHVKWGSALWMTNCYVRLPFLK
jgi:hypothetical protein